MRLKSLDQSVDDLILITIKLNAVQNINNTFKNKIDILYYLSFFYLFTFPNSMACTDRALTLVGDSGRDAGSWGINIRVYQRPGVDVQNPPATEVFLNMLLHCVKFYK